jgi:hypothetical protein
MSVMKRALGAGLPIAGSAVFVHVDPERSNRQTLPTVADGGSWLVAT